MTRVELTSGAWFGDNVIELDFPSNWRVMVLGDNKIPGLAIEKIKEKMNDPAGKPALSIIAMTRTKAAIIIDDITRPTPTYVILPLIIEELKKAGFDADSIKIIIASGIHRKAAKEEIRKKLGDAVDPKIEVIPHDCRKDLEYLGKSSLGTPIYINKAVMECDLKIGVGCIYPHPVAGFSGGSKIIMPGVAGIETASHMHDFLRGSKRGGSIDIELRQDIEEVAGKVGLDFIINAVLNQKRQIAGIFAGDKILAHRQGVEFASAAYGIVPVYDADIIISDMYPFDTSLQFVHDRGFWPLLEGNRNSVKIAIAECPMGLGTHGLSQLSTSVMSRILHRIRHFRSEYLFLINTRIRAMIKYHKLHHLDFAMISGSITKKELGTVFSNSELFCTWDAFLEDFIARHNDMSPSVVIYKCSPLLFPVDNGI